MERMLFGLLATNIVGMLGCYAMAYKWHNDTMQKIAEIYKHIEDKTVTKEHCAFAQQTISKDLTDISKDVKFLIRRLIDKDKED